MASGIAKTAIREAAEESAKRSIRELAPELSEAAARQAIEAAVKASAEATTKEAAERLAREAAEASIKKSVRENIDVAAKASIREAGQQTAESAAKKNASWVAQHPKLVLGGVAAATIGGIALNNFIERDGKVLQITSIKNDDKGVRIQYTPMVKITTNDIVTVKDTNTVPVLNDEFEVVKRISDSEIIINRLPLNTEGDDGEMVLHTSYESQLAGVVTDIGETAGEAAGGAVGAGVSAAAESSGLSDLLGFDASILLWIIVGIIGFVVLLYVIRMLMNNRRQ